MNADRTTATILAPVAGHLLLTVLHGLVHLAIPVFPTGWTATFVAVILYIVPIVGGGLVVGGYQRVGAAVFVSAGVASFVLEGAFHFLLSNPDHIAHVAAYHASFSLTAILTTLGNFLLIWAAWLAVRGM